MTVTSSQFLSSGTLTGPRPAGASADWRPGAPNRTNTGNPWPRHPIHGGLRLPTGDTLDNTPNELLRSELSRLGIADAATAPRDSLINAYAALLTKIHDDAGRSAVAAWLESHRS